MTIRSGAFSALPSEIIYIESVANYIIVAHFHNNEPRQTRLRGTLHYVEETLKTTISSCISIVHSLSMSTM